ncbi:MAG: hypothetical protein PHU04_02965 [Candidatus Peribacteraceae bacterium]|nr:hypothetical protein [Candidatus Peribacteraceae bacterium]
MEEKFSRDRSDVPGRKPLSASPEHTGAQFDAYHKWLGIPPQEQPPNHYRLLGISQFESDVDVISHAADQRMAHVRTLQVGRHSGLSQRILNEISSARVCLLDAGKRAVYDTQLRTKIQRQESPPPAPPVLTVGPEVPAISPVTQQRNAVRSKAHNWTIAGVLGATVAIGGVVGWVRSRVGGPEEERVPAAAKHLSQTEVDAVRGVPPLRGNRGAAPQQAVPIENPHEAEQEQVTNLPVLPELPALPRDPEPRAEEMVSIPSIPTIPPVVEDPAAGATLEHVETGAQLERMRQVAAKTLAAVTQKNEQGCEKIMDALRSEGDGVVRAGMALGAAELAAQCGRVDLLQEALQRLEQDAGSFCTHTEVLRLKADAAMQIAPASITNPMLRRRDEEAWLQSEQQRVEVAAVLMDGATGAWKMDDNAQSSAYLARARTHIFGDTGSGLAGAFVGHKAYKEQGEHARHDLEEMEAENARQAAMLEQVQALLEGGVSPQNASEHQSLGEYLLLARGDWERGLPHVAQGTDRAMAEAAKLTLQGGDTAEERVAVVRAWLRVAGENERMRRVAEQAASVQMGMLRSMSLTGPEKLVVDGLEREGVGGSAENSSRIQNITNLFQRTRTNYVELRDGRIQATLPSGNIEKYPRPMISSNVFPSGSYSVTLSGISLSHIQWEERGETKHGELIIFFPINGQDAKMSITHNELWFFIRSQDKNAEPVKISYDRSMHEKVTEAEIIVEQFASDVVRITVKLNGKPVLTRNQATISGDPKLLTVDAVSEGKWSDENVHGNLRIGLWHQSVQIERISVSPLSSTGRVPGKISIKALP